MVFGIGPFQGPRGISWGGGKIATLQIDSVCTNRNDAEYSPVLSGMPFGGSYNVNLPPLVRFPASGGPPILFVASAAMKAYFQMWSYPVYSLRTVTHTPASSVTSYYVWFDFGDPFPGVPPNDFENNIAWDSTWDNFADAQARADDLNGGGNPHHVEEFTLVSDAFDTFKRTRRTAIFFNLSKIATDFASPFHFQLAFRAGGVGTPAERIEWDTLIRTYKGKNEFPVNAQNVPLWEFPFEDRFQHDEDNGGESPANAFEIQVNIDLDSLQISGEVTEL